MWKWVKTLTLAATAGCLICSSATAYSNKYKLNWDLDGFVELNAQSAGDEEPTTYTARKGSKFVILDRSKTSLTVVFLGGKKKESKTDDTDTASTPATGGTTKLVKPDKVYTIDKTIMAAYHYSYHNGFSFGTLVVPFKMRSRNRSLSGQSSLGPFAGWRLGSRWGAVTLMATAGLVMIPVSELNSGKKQNRAGLTYGVGIVLETVDRFQVGFVAGADHLGEKDNPDWEFEDNLWLSFSIGFGFLGSD